MRIMMSAAGSPVAPGIIRHLQKLGHRVSGHDTCGLGAGSSLCDLFLTSPPVTYPSFLEWLSIYDFDLYLPFLDEELLTFAAYGPPDGVMCSPKRVLTVFTSKIRQQHAMQARGLPVAPQWWASDGGDWIAKPEYSRGSRGLLRGTDSMGDLARAIEESGYLIQRRIFGDEYTVDALCARGGKLLYAVPRLRIQAKGVSTIGQIVMDPELIELTRALTEKLEFYGPINVQFIRDPRTWETYIIEVNARLSGSCMFTVMAGWDILNDAIRLHEGKPFEPPKCIKDGMIVRRYYVEEEA